MREFVAFMFLCIAVAVDANAACAPTGTGLECGDMGSRFRVELPLGSWYATDRVLVLNTYSFLDGWVDRGPSPLPREFTSGTAYDYWPVATDDEFYLAFASICLFVEPADGSPQCAISEPFQAGYSEGVELPEADFLTQLVSGVVALLVLYSFLAWRAES